MPMRLAKLAALGVVAAAALTPAALAITPDSQVDQSQTVTEGCLTVTPALIVGQVFTAGVSGRLSDVVLTLGNTTAAVGSLHVALTRTDGLGHPDLATEIAGVNLSASAVPTPGPGGVDLQFGDPTLTAGHQYALVVSTTDPDGFDICGAGSIDYYVPGQAWETVDGGASWLVVNGDAHFTTYMLPLDLSRVGYCLGGRFLDLVAGQPDADPRYSGAVPAIFVKGIGVTCGPPPPGYTQQGRTTDSDNVGAGKYALYAPAE